MGAGLEMGATWQRTTILLVVLWVACSSGAYMGHQDEQNTYFGENVKTYPAHKYQATKDEEKWDNQIRPPSPSKNTNLVLNLVSTLLGAIQSEQCLERLLCELGWSLSDVEAARVVVQLAGVYVPPEHAQLLSAFRDAVMRVASCSQYRCGKLPLRDEL